LCPHLGHPRSSGPAGVRSVSVGGLIAYSRGDERVISLLSIRPTLLI
jgi:hypothetical protein